MNALLNLVRNLVRLCILMQLLSAAVNAMPIRSYNGSDNNASNPDWGQAGNSLLRLTPAAYDDGASTPRGGIPTSLPSARAISEAASAQTGSTVNRKRASDWLWQWGQFLDHDLDLSPPSHAGNEAFNIAVPLGDASFDPMRSGMAEIPLQRSEFIVDQNGVRQQINEITSFIDASNVYGSDAARAAILRDNEKYLRMTVGQNGEILLGQNTLGAANDTGGNPNAAEFFLAGDVRANEQIGLTAVHTVFAREHNRLVDEMQMRLMNGDTGLRAARDSSIATLGNGVDNENDFLFEAARKVVGAQIQKITYSEFLPVLLGTDLTHAYTGYDASVNAGVSNEFSTAAFRLGHTMLPSSLLRISEHGGNRLIEEVQLRDAFFKPSEVFENGIDSLLLGLAAREAQAIDTLLVDDVRNFLFGPPGAGGLDLASLNIQRGRDHGLGSLNAVREALGLGRYLDFDQITNGDLVLASALDAVYDDVDDVDLWIGGLAEAALGASMLGETFTHILRDQFMRSMHGDRFFYLGEEMDMLSILAPDFMTTTSLSELILRNSAITSIQSNAFIVVPEPAGLGLLLMAFCALIYRPGLSFTPLRTAL